MLDEAIRLAAIGFAVHWLREKKKSPVDEGWSSAPVHTPETLRQAYKPGYNVGIRLGEPSKIGGLYVHAVDFDVKDEASRDEARAALVELLPEVDSLPTVLSGSGGASRHHYFLSDRPFRSRKLARSKGFIASTDGRKQRKWEIELFGTGKQVAAPPSIHPSGKPYRWARESDLDAAEMDLWPTIDASRIQAWGASVEHTEDTADLESLAHNRPTDHTIDDARDLLNALSADDDLREQWCEDREGWLKIGMALHHQFGTGEQAEDAYDLWCEFSRQSPKFDEGVQRKTWDAFRPRADSVTLRTLTRVVNAARRHEAFNEGADEPASETKSDEGDALGLDDIGKPDDTLESGPRAEDYQNARLFAKRWTGVFRYVPEVRRWRRWDGVHWANCTAEQELGAAGRVASECLKKATARLDAAKGEDERQQAKENLKRAVGMHTAYKLKCMLELARRETGIITESAKFDADPMLLGVRNGVLDLRTGKLHAPDPEMLIHQQAGCPFDPAAAAPKWQAFLEQVQPDSAVRDFLQQAVGYTLTGLIDAEVFFILYGTGANGKSVFGTILAALMGDMTAIIGNEALALRKTGDTGERTIARLPGKRLALANETNQGDIWNDGRLKQMASRESMKARELYKEEFEFWPTHKLWIRSNHLPGSIDGSDGFWRRITPIKFGVQIPEAEQIQDLDRQIIAEELPGVLNWALAGCMAWQKAGRLDPPESIRADRASYREDTDVPGEWIDEHCIRDPEGTMTVSAAYRSYVDFCRAQGVHPPSSMSFVRIMGDRGIKKVRASGNRKIFIRYRLRDYFSDTEADALI